MKLVNLFVIFFFITAINILAQDKVIWVSDTEEFVKAIGSDRTIKLKGGTYDLSEMPPDISSDNYYSNVTYDGYELVITDVKNMKIEGTGLFRMSKIVTEPVYGNVLVFDKCDNITIENIEAGHSPNSGGCTGGVLKFDYCNNIKINDCILYGSGMEGITCYQVTGLKCNNSVIKKCTYGIMTLTESKDIELKDCDFTDNMEYNMVNISTCSDVKFNKCSFSYNKSGIEYEYSDYCLFYITESGETILNNCKFTGNKFNYFCNDKNSLKMTGTDFIKNIFSTGMYQENTEN